jgi:hypothetical protein
MANDPNASWRDEREFLDRLLQPRLEQAERAYSQALTSLWIGNGGATLATLSFVGATWNRGGSIRPLLWPLGFFIVGLVSMGLGAAGALLKEAVAIRRMQKVTSIVDLQMRDWEAPRPAEGIGLSLKNWRTIMGCISGACFLIGCCIGFVQLYIAVP